MNKGSDSETAERTTCRIRSSHDHAHASLIDAHWLASAECRIGTPLGLPVLPEVKSMKPSRERSKGSEEIVGRETEPVS